MVVCLDVEGLKWKVEILLDNTSKVTLTYSNADNIKAKIAFKELKECIENGEIIDKDRVERIKNNE